VELTQAPVTYEYYRCYQGSAIPGGWVMNTHPPFFSLVLKRDLIAGLHQNIAKTFTAYQACGLTRVGFDLESETMHKLVYSGI
jgi:hypothetical protein